MSVVIQRGKIEPYRVTNTQLHQVASAERLSQLDFTHLTLCPFETENPCSEIQNRLPEDLQKASFAIFGEMHQALECIRMSETVGSDFTKADRWVMCAVNFNTLQNIHLREWSATPSKSATDNRIGRATKLSDHSISVFANSRTMSTFPSHNESKGRIPPKLLRSLKKNRILPQS